MSKVKEAIQIMRDNSVIMGRRTHTLAIIERESYVSNLLSDAKFADKKRLEPYGFKVYSQNDEDGIIQEIFQRVGAVNKTFVEFGVESGLENNTLKLLLEGWRGLWLEGDDKSTAAVRSKFAKVIESGQLQVRQAFIDRDNINELIAETFQGEIDLISIDIDGNDIYILENLHIVNPRVVVIEYNGKFPPPMSIAQSYNPKHIWDGTDYGGSSLAAIVKVASRKGYSLVGCNIMGLNAFFVRDDLLSENFCMPYTAENHYQPARYFLWQTFVAGHPPNWGDYVSI